MSVDGPPARHDRDELFVDRCQLLGCRTVVGDRRLEQRLLSRVLHPHVFDQAEALSERIAREIEEHREQRCPGATGTLHLKEDAGGMREIDLALATARARLRFWDGLTATPFGALAERDPDRASLYRELEAIDELLVAVRSAYRIAVAATDEIEPDLLSAPARILGRADRDDPAAGVALFADLQQRLLRSAGLVDELAGVRVRRPA